MSGVGQVNAAATKIDSAMVLAAGFGRRMAPITDTTPKPLVRLAGRPLIDWALDRLAAGGVTRFVVNTHYLSDQLESHFKDRPEIALSHEEMILESGGGVRAALGRLGPNPFFVANADAVWLDGVSSAVDRMRRAWDPARMDILLLLTPSVGAYGYDGPGDYRYDADGTPHHRGEDVAAPFAFAGLQIIKPSCFDDAPQGSFSLRRLYDQAEAKGRLSAITHDGEWYHVGTEDALREIETVIAEGYTRANTR